MLFGNRAPLPSYVVLSWTGERYEPVARAPSQGAAELAAQTLLKEGRCDHTHVVASDGRLVTTMTCEIDLEPEGSKAVRIGIVGSDGSFSAEFSKSYDVRVLCAEPHDILQPGDWSETAGTGIGSSRYAIVTSPRQLRGCNFFIILPDAEAGPSEASNPLPPEACSLIGEYLSRGSTVIFHSSAYPGWIEEVCGPELEKCSGLRCGTDFSLAFVADPPGESGGEYRANDPTHVIAAQDSATLALVVDLYSTSLRTRISPASSIRVAEAAQFLDCIRRDINVALMNELSTVWEEMGINTLEVLRASRSKLDLSDLKPRLTTVHAGTRQFIGKAEQLGTHPELLLASMRSEQATPARIASRVVQLLGRSDSPLRSLRVGVLGVSSDDGNARFADKALLQLCKELRRFGIDPMIDLDLSEEESCGGSLDALIVGDPRHLGTHGSLARITRQMQPGTLVCDLTMSSIPQQIAPHLRHWSPSGMIDAQEGALAAT